MKSYFKKDILILGVLLITISGCKRTLDKKNLLSDNEKQFYSSYPKLISNIENKSRSIFENDSLQGDLLFAIVDSSGLVYSYVLNQNILAGKPSTLSIKSPIYIASHTKSFTGTLLAQLEEGGLVKLDSPLLKYLPELTYDNSIDNQVITIKSLLNHTHGTFSTSLTWKTAYLGYGGDDQELIHDINNDFLYDSSHRFRYSNVGPIIAGMVVDNVTGHSWKEEMEKRIFKPLKMDHTSTKVSDFRFNKIRPSVAVSHNKIVETGFYKQDITMHASGGIISTIEDLAKWLQANINEDDQILSKSGWDKLHESTTEQNRTYFTYHRTGYSLGWDIAEYHGDTLLTRFGSMAGITFHISYIPSKKVGVIGFTSDSRDFYLSSLLANYAYNQMIRPDSAETIYDKEEDLFQAAFDKYANEPSPVLDNPLLLVSSDNNSIVGTYTNSKNWPLIEIKSNDSTYQFNWGVLQGEVYMDSTNSYIVPLGPLDRSFTISHDTLRTGSLMYIKTR